MLGSSVSALNTTYKMSLPPGRYYWNRGPETSHLSLWTKQACNAVPGKKLFFNIPIHLYGSSSAFAEACKYVIWNLLMGTCLYLQVFPNCHVRRKKNHVT